MHGSPEKNTVEVRLSEQEDLIAESRRAEEILRRKFGDEITENTGELYASEQNTSKESRRTGEDYIAKIKAFLDEHEPQKPDYSTVE